MDDSLRAFLVSRGTPDFTIENMCKEKIDIDVIPMLNETGALSQFIPALGDRMAVVDFCKRRNCKRKQGLIDKIKSKINKNQTQTLKNTEEFSVAAETNRYPHTKSERQLEIGWVCEKEGQLVQIRSKQGGGTRKVKVCKSAKKEDILKIAKDLFFPNKISHKGKLEEFVCTILDFKQCELDSDLSIGDLYNITKLPSLRFYLCTRKRILPLSSTVTAPSISSFDYDFELSNSGFEQTPHKMTTSEYMTTEGFANHLLSQEYVPDVVGATVEVGAESSNLNYGLEGINRFEGTMEVGAESPSLNYDIDGSQASETDRDLSNAKKVTFHRGQIYKEFLQFFSTPQTEPIKIQMIKPNGELEMAVDTGGVLRDALTEFWSTFYEVSTNGTRYKVPILRHDMSTNEWSAVAHILYFGWKHEKYFPVKLSPAFMEYCLYGCNTINMTDDLLKVVSAGDEETLQLALTDFQTCEEDELLEILSQFDCKWQPTEQNIVQLLGDIAYKEIIQKPKFVIDCWRSILSNLIQFEEFRELYTKLKATAKNIIPLITTVSVHDSDSLRVLGYLKKFIREATDDSLQNLMRFITGADIITTSAITIDFNVETGLKGIPVAHTCSNTLHLSKKYDNFTDFRSELNSVLNSNYWVMDIV